MEQSSIRFANHRNDFLSKKPIRHIDTNCMTYMSTAFEMWPASTDCFFFRKKNSTKWDVDGRLMKTTKC